MLFSIRVVFCGMWSASLLVGGGNQGCAKSRAAYTADGRPGASPCAHATLLERLKPLPARMAFATAECFLRLGV